MDWDDCRAIHKKVCDANWAGYARTLYDQQLPAWLSERHPQRLPCRFEGDFDEHLSGGSFNFIFIADFLSGERWVVRFPRPSGFFLDAKIEAEVAAINLIRQRTDIPVPKILSWGAAAENELGLGPFMIYEFMEGVQLADLLTDPEDHLFKDNLSEDLVCDMIRQIARFMLQLSKIDFTAIGGLPVSAVDQTFPKVVGPPITLKAQDMMQLGGVDRVSSHSVSFSSSLEYFEYLADGDIVQLYEQLNSVDDAEDAANKLTNWHAIKELIPRFCKTNSRNGPFKLICDDFGPFNMLVRSMTDPIIVAVLDWEFSYAGPRELFWTPSRWLIGERPKSWFDSGNTARYLQNLEIYIRMLAEVEEDVLGKQLGVAARPSSLVRQAAKDGSVWFFHILREAFNGPKSILFENLRRDVPKLESFAKVSPEEVQAFVVRKSLHLDEYAKLLEAKEHWFEEWQKL